MSQGREQAEGPGETGCAGAKLLLLPPVPSHPRTHGRLTLAGFK